MSESVKNKIVEGKYVNLASTLLISEYELLKESKAMKDPRLAESLSIEEFIIAITNISALIAADSHGVD